MFELSVPDLYTLVYWWRKQQVVLYQSRFNICSGALIFTQQQADFIHQTQRFWYSEIERNTAAVQSIAIILYSISNIYLCPTINAIHYLKRSTMIYHPVWNASCNEELKEIMQHRGLVCGLHHLYCKKNGNETFFMRMVLCNTSRQHVMNHVRPAAR